MTPRRSHTLPGWCTYTSHVLLHTQQDRGEEENPWRKSQIGREQGTIALYYVL